jgi:hypothetical protein
LQQKLGCNNFVFFLCRLQRGLNDVPHCAVHNASKQAVTAFAQPERGSAALAATTSTAQKRVHHGQLHHRLHLRQIIFFGGRILVRLKHELLVPL